MSMSNGMPCGMNGNNRKLDRSILFIEKVFLRRAPETLRGVELFNMRLLRDLGELGWNVRVPADKSWRDVFNKEFGGVSGVEFVYAGRGSVIKWLWFVALGCRHDVLLVGNVGNLIGPLVCLAGKMKKAGRCVLIAHRETSAGFLKSLECWRGSCVVIAVNGKIARPFAEAGFEVRVDYGIMNAEDFYPRRQTPGGGAAGIVCFCVVGMLDNSWKGADTAIAAFRKMPAEVRERSELHLASYSTPPGFPESNIVARAWMPASEIGEWLRGMDVMLCPSRDEEVMRETFSQAIVQGMLTGLPVLASDLQVFREKLDKGGGEIFRDVEDLSRKMQELVLDADKRLKLGREGRATALERYVWDSSVFASRYLPGQAHEEKSA